MATNTNFDGTTLTVERTYNAPQESVFDAWITASKTTHWWGCGSTTKVVSTIDPSKGGSYQHLMSIEGVGDYLIDGVFLEFRPPELLSYKMAGSEGMPEMIVQVTFEDLGDQTKVTLTQSPLPDILQDTVAAGWTASFDRLDSFFTGYRRSA